MLNLLQNHHNELAVLRNGRFSKKFARYRLKTFLNDCSIVSSFFNPNIFYTCSFPAGFLAAGVQVIPFSWSVSRLDTVPPRVLVLTVIH